MREYIFTKHRARSNNSACIRVCEPSRLVVTDRFFTFLRPYMWRVATSNAVDELLLYIIIIICKITAAVAVLILLLLLRPLDRVNKRFEGVRTGPSVRAPVRRT